jgi:hypothetical protein
MSPQARPKLNPVKEHLQAMHTSSELTRWFRREREPAMVRVTPENVIAALNRVKINPVLMGTYGLGGYRSEPRATQDVDVLVKEIRNAVRILVTEFPNLELCEDSTAIHLLSPANGKPLIDVMKPTAKMRLVFRHTIRIGKTHRIPELEMGLVCKFIAMRAPNRRFTRGLLNLCDFIDIFEHNRTVVDLAKLEYLAENSQRGGGDRILRIGAEIDAGRGLGLMAEAGGQIDG